MISLIILISFGLGCLLGVFGERLKRRREEQKIREKIMESFGYVRMAGESYDALLARAKQHMMMPLPRDIKPVWVTEDDWYNTVHEDGKKL